MRLQIPVAAVLAVLGAGWCAAADSVGADNGSTEAATSTSPLTPQGFVDQAASAGMLEVQSSQLALSKGTDQQVRDFAQHMIDDHQKANQELSQLAQRKGWTVKQDLAADDQKVLDKLQGYTGEEFSRQYVKLQVKAHDEAVALFDRGGRELRDPDLRQWAQQMLPTLQQHRQMAQDLKAQEKTSKAEGWRQGGTQSGTVGSDSWSSQSSADGGSSNSSAQGSSSGSLGTTGTATIESDIHGTAKMPGPAPAQPGDQTAPAGATANPGYRPSGDAGAGGQNQGATYQDQPNQQKRGSGY